MPFIGPHHKTPQVLCLIGSKRSNCRSTKWVTWLRHFTRGEMWTSLVYSRIHCVRNEPRTFLREDFMTVWGMQEALVREHPTAPTWPQQHWRTLANMPWKFPWVWREVPLQRSRLETNKYYHGRKLKGIMLSTHTNFIVFRVERDFKLRLSCHEGSIQAVHVGVVYTSPGCTLCCIMAPL